MIREKILNRQSSYGGIKINIVLVLMNVLLMTCMCQNPQSIERNRSPIEISLQYGHNSYTQLSRYFGSSQQFMISDMKSEVDLKNYHFCYIQTSTYSQVEISDTLSISNEVPQSSSQSKENINTKLNNNKNTNQKYNNQALKDKNIDRSHQQQEKIVYNLDDIISTENVLATQFYYHTQRQTQTSTKSTSIQFQSFGLLLIVMPNKYITLKLQQYRLTQSQPQQQTNQVKQKRYKVSSKLSTSFSQNVTVAKFIKINNNNNINNDKDNTSKEEYVLMTDRELFKVQIDKNRIKEQNYYGSVFINGRLSTIQENTVIRNLQQINQLQNNQTEINAVNQQHQQQQQQQQQKQQQQQQQKQGKQQQQQQKQGKQQQQQQKQGQQQQQQQQQKQQQQQQQKQGQQEGEFQVEQQNQQQSQQVQHFSSGVSISNKEILVYSNKNIYLYDIIQGKLNKLNTISQSTNKNNNKLYTQLIGNKNMQLSIIQYSNINNNKDKVNNKESQQQQSSLLLIAADRGSDIKLTYYNNQTQLLNSFSQQTNKEYQQSPTTTKQTTHQQSILQQQLYSLSNTHKCRHVHSYNNQYIFVQCKNHLIYYSLQQIINCKPNNTNQSNNNSLFNSKTLQFNNKTQTCINSIKGRHLNLGYHIQSIYLNEQTNQLTVTGIDKYQIFHIDYNSQLHIINSIKHINTYYFNTQNIKQVFIINYNYSLILTKTNLFIVKQLPQTKQIYCKTIDQHTHKGLSQPTGVFNGNITVQGICQDNYINTNNNKQYSRVQRVQNSTYCRYTVPITVNITYVVKTYEFLWYILLGIGIFLTIIGVLYCLIKRQKLSQIYKTLEEENQHGQQVVQHTVITESNESQQQAIGIDALK